MAENPTAPTRTVTKAAWICGADITIRTIKQREGFEEVYAPILLTIRFYVGVVCLIYNSEKHNIRHFMIALLSPYCIDALMV